MHYFESLLGLINEHFIGLRTCGGGVRFLMKGVSQRIYLTANKAISLLSFKNAL